MKDFPIPVVAFGPGSQQEDEELGFMPMPKAEPLVAPLPPEDAPEEDREAAAAVVEQTLGYVKERRAFGRAIGSFQNTRFVLAELVTQLDVAQAYVDRCIEAHVAGRLTPVDAAKAKWWCTELQGRVVDACVQLHGGYGYMIEYPIARAWQDSRVTRIYAGTTEIMKEIIGRSLDLG